MADPRHALGSAAETAVGEWLEACGWRIVGRRVRSPAGGEVDLVAIDPADVLVAIEVRARRSARAGRAGLSVDARRVARLRRTLVASAVAVDVPHAGLRVDLVTVEPDFAGSWRVVRLPGIG
ncbi:MAG TPA: YraN family protein [Candidatus Limnocylindria bacterium]|nr:YraN family protein [Candidatus Limnocylindria bacterium]